MTLQAWFVVRLEPGLEEISLLIKLPFAVRPELGFFYSAVPRDVLSFSRLRCSANWRFYLLDGFFDDLISVIESFYESLDVAIALCSG